VRDALYRVQEAFFALICNLPSPLAAALLRWIVFPLGRQFRVPPDAIGREIARTLSTPGPARERLTRGAYVPRGEDEAVGALEAALKAVIAAEPVEAKVRAAEREGTLSRTTPEDTITAAVRGGTISATEAELLREASRLRRKAIMVDDFPRDLGRSELHQTTEAVSYEPLQRAFEETRAGSAV
jgi:acyl-CoA dehydrogenase